MASTLTVEIVTSERIVFSDSDVDMVTAPGSEGMLGILPNHAPLVTTLSAGELRIKKGGTEQSMVVFGGFMEVLPDKVIVLADVAEKVEEIDLQRAEEARQPRRRGNCARWRSHRSRCRRSAPEPRPGPPQDRRSSSLGSASNRRPVGSIRV